MPSKTPAASVPQLGETQLLSRITLKLNSMCRKWNFKLGGEIARVLRLDLLSHCLLCFKKIGFITTEKAAMTQALCLGSCQVLTLAQPPGTFGRVGSICSGRQLKRPTV